MEPPVTNAPSSSDPAPGKPDAQSVPSAEQKKQEEQDTPLWESWWAIVYFLYWKQTKSFRRWFQTSVFILIVLGLGTLLEFALGLEILPEVEKWLHKVLANGYVFTVLVLAILIVSVHHVREWRRPEYESAFVKSLFDFGASYRENFRDGKPMTLVQALEKFYPIFERAHVHYLAVFLEHDGSLRVNPEHVHPRYESPEEYYPVLPVGKGVAGRVYEDSCTRYMPCCFLRKKDFTHALKYSAAGGGNLSEEVPDFGAYRPHGKKALYQSLLCVPLSRVENQNLGVLNISFKKRGTLNCVDITMAMVVGLVLGQALPYLDKDAE